MKKYKEDIKNAKPVGKEINNQWASSTLGVCLKDGQKARNMGAESLKNFFGPDRPYVQGQKDIYAQLLEKWGGVPDHLRQNFSRYIDGDDGPELDNALDFSGGEAIALNVCEDFDSDSLFERGFVIAGDPDDCIRALKKHEETGIDQMMVMMQTETVPHAEVMESIELWGKYIIPEFNK